MLNEAMRRDWVAASIVWSGFDYNSGDDYGENNYVKCHGTMDLMRIPKYACYMYQSQRDVSRPMVYIANFWLPNSPTDVRIYSNYEQVRLSKWNGSDWTVFATQEPDQGTALAHPPFTFSLSSHDTERLKAEGLIDGEVAATHVVREPGDPAGLVAEVGPDTIWADGGEMSRFLVSIVDENGTVCPYARANINMEISGPGELIGELPMRASTQQATHQCGSFGVLVRSKFKEQGPIIITASSNGLGTCSDTIYAIEKPVPVSLVSKKTGIGNRAPVIRSSMNQGLLTLRFARIPPAALLNVRIYTASGRLVTTVVKEDVSSSSIDVPCDIRYCSRGVYIVSASVNGKMCLQSTFLRL
jgi:hypothetical protein